jgi:hypothetical protein
MTGGGCVLAIWRTVVLRKDAVVVVRWRYTMAAIGIKTMLKNAMERRRRLVMSIRATGPGLVVFHVSGISAETGIPCMRSAMDVGVRVAAMQLAVAGAVRST